MARIDTLANPKGPAPKVDPLAEILGLSGLGGDEELLRDQLAQADALRNMPSEHHSTGLGGALGSISQALNAAAGAFQGQDARRQLGAISKQRELGRSAYAHLPGAQQLLLQALSPGYPQDPTQGRAMLGPSGAPARPSLPPGPWNGGGY